MICPGYASQAWVVLKSEEKNLLIFERKILRIIFGPVKEGGIWRSRKNKKLCEPFGEADLVSVVEVNRLRWAGHVLRMSEGEVTRKLFEGAIAG